MTRDDEVYCTPEGLCAVRILREAEPWSHCPDCTGSNTMWVKDHFTCKDCCNEWKSEFNFYDREPEINPDR